MDEAADSKSANAEEHDAGPARALTLHLLRMFETRADAAAIALQSEMQSFSARMQLRLIAAGAMFIALWGAIVLLAIVLPPHLRVPVLGVVVAALVIGAVWAHLAAKRKVSSRDVGSMTWFLDGLRLDLEVLSRSLANSRAQSTPAAAPEPEQRSAPSDIAA
jgi:uncharacterized membrane protein YqjE